MSDKPSWLKDSIVEIERVVKASMIITPTIVDLKHEKAGTYAIVTPMPAGSPANIVVKVAGPKWHNETLADYRQLAKFIESVCADADDIEAGAVFISESQIHYVRSLEDRRDFATVVLEKTKPWKWLESVKAPLDQRELIKVLRLVFDGCLPDDSNLVGLIRNVKWRNDQGVESNIQRGKEALGRQILNEVTGMSDFPDEFFVRVRMYEGVPFEQVVRVSLDPLPDIQKFEVLPFPSQLEIGKQNTLAKLQEEIGETGVPTFIGTV